MRALLSRLPLCRPPRQLWVYAAARGKARKYHPTPGNSNTPKKSELMFHLLPELPPAPRYPCPFLTATDIETYILPLYRFGWGVSRVPINNSGAKTAPPATRLSRRITLLTDIVGRFAEDMAITIVEPENHHPTLEQQSQDAIMSAVDIHVHTHTARAPLDCQNVDDQEKYSGKRPGITLRDIRFAILVERLLLNYTHGRSLDAPSSAFYPQPIDIYSLHNFRAPPPEVHEPTEK